MSKLNYGQIIKAVYNEEENALNTTTVESSGPVTSPSKLDFGQILKSVYDEESNSLRTTGGGGGDVSSVNGQTGEVELDAVDKKLRIYDGTNWIDIN